MNNEDAKIALFEYDSDTLAEAYKQDDIYDIISECADSNVDVYNYDLLKWLPDNYNYVEDAIEEFGFPTNDGKPDMIKAIMQGQYKQNEEALTEAWEDLKSDIADYFAVNTEEEENTENIVKAIELLKAKN